MTTCQLRLAWFYVLVCLLLHMSIRPISSFAQSTGSELVLTACVPSLGAITGQVTAADTGQPLAFVDVYAYLGAITAKLGATDQEGRYVLAGLRPGTYHVKFANKPPYAGEWYNNQPAQTMATPIVVSSGITTTAIDGVLDRGAGISGTVTAVDTGAPLKEVSVQVYDLTGNPTGSGTTDSQGRYKIEGLMSGDYRLSFHPLTFGPANPYLAEWYNDKADQASADIVSVIAPNVIGDINVALARGGQISGKVMAADTGSELYNVSVRVYDGTGKLFLSAYTDASGVYTTSALPGGSYTLYFEPSNFGAAAPYVGEWYNDKSEQAAADVISVTTSNVITNVNALLTRGGAISGKVTAADTGANVTGTLVYVYNFAGDQVGFDFLDTSSVYTITGLPSGNYKVRFAPFGLSSDYLAEWYSDKATETTADSITVNAPNTTANIDATLVKGGQIRGRVTAEESGIGLRDVDVWVYDQNGRYFTALSTNASGYYTITAVTTGNYFVEFEPRTGGVAANYIAEWYNNKADRSSADVVSVTAPNVTTNIDAALSMGNHICGIVTASDTGVGLDNVTIRIYSAAGQYQDSLSTDASGSYVSPALADGSYKLEFYPPSRGIAASYLGEWYNDKPTQASADPIALTRPNADTVINASLAKGGQISGKITLTGANSGASDVDIGVYDQNNRFAGSASVNTAGVYTTTALPVGNYKILAQPRGVRAQSYALQWYHDKPNQSDADLVTLSAITVVHNIDFVLTPGGRIAGRVTAADTGAGLDDVSIRIYDANEKFVSTTSADANGDYITPGLRNGSYKLLFSTFGNADGYTDEWYNQQSDSTAATVVVVTSPNTTTGINAVLEKQSNPPLSQKVFLPIIQK